MQQQKQTNKKQQQNKTQQLNEMQHRNKNFNKTKPWQQNITAKTQKWFPRHRLGLVLDKIDFSIK